MGEPANRKKGTGSLGNQVSGKRSAHTNSAPHQIHELRFLRYRLEVVRSWPDSPRKQILIEAIEERLSAICQLPSLI